MGKPYVYLPILDPLRQELLDWAAQNITDTSLDPEGRELNPHITLAYGVADNKLAVLRALTPILRGTSHVRTTISFATHFRHKARSVLVLICSSAPLIRYAAALQTAFHLGNPTLNAHITLAYIRSGREQRSSGLLGFVGRVVESDHLVFVDQDKNHHLIQL